MFYLMSEISGEGVNPRRPRERDGPAGPDEEEVSCPILFIRWGGLAAALPRRQEMVRRGPPPCWGVEGALGLPAGEPCVALAG